MAEDTEDNMAAKIQRQTPGWNGAGAIFGGSILGPVRSTAGVTLLPESAALLGSGAMEGRNPYQFVVPGWNGVGIGTFGGLLGYGAPLAGIYSTYRVMLSHPTIVLARATVTAPIIAGAWSYEADDDAPEGAIDLVKRTFEPMRVTILTEMLRALDHGFTPFVVDWGKNEDGFKVPVRVRALLPDNTQLLIDDYGTLTGLRNGNVQITDPDWFFVHTYDREGDNYYGRSRLENVRRTWANWLTDEDQLARLAQKASGIVPKVGFPADAKAPDDPAQSNYNKALAIIRGLSTARGVAFQNLTPAVEQAMANGNADFAGKSLWNIELLDMGNTGPAQTALLEALRYRDALICRGYLRSERSVIEANTAGSRADSETHTATISDTDCDIVHAQACETLNATLVRSMLVENFGPKCARCVRIVAKQLVDENKLIDTKILDALLAGQASAPEVFRRIDLDAFFDRNNLQMRPEAPDWDEAEFDAPDPDPAGAEDKMNAEADAAKAELSAAMFGGEVIA